MAALVSQFAGRVKLACRTRRITALILTNLPRLGSRILITPRMAEAPLRNLRCFLNMTGPNKNLEGQQMIYRYGGPGSDIGLTPWLAITYNPQQSINQLPLLALAGVIYHGLIPRRGDDNLGCGFYFGQLSTALPEPTGEKVMELYYTLWATPWLAITPDFQYVFNPSGGSSSRNASVPGVQFQVLF